MPIVEERTPIGQQRWLTFQNTGSVSIPAFGALEVTNSTKARVNHIVLNCQRPSAAGLCNVAFNGPIACPVNQYGRCTYDLPTFSLYDTGAAPAVGEIWGTQADSFLLGQNIAGFYVHSLTLTEPSRVFVYKESISPWTVLTKTAAYTLKPWEDVRFSPPSTPNLTATLPALADVCNGDELMIRLLSSNGNLISEEGVIIDPNGAEKIYGKWRDNDGALSNVYLYFDHEYIHLRANPADSQWEIIGGALMGEPGAALIQDNAHTGITSTSFVAIQSDTVGRTTLSGGSGDGRLHVYQGSTDYCVQTLYDAIVDINGRYNVELTAGAVPPYNVEVCIQARIGAGGAWSPATRTNSLHTFTAVGEIHSFSLAGRFQTNVESGIRAAIRVASGATVQVLGDTSQQGGYLTVTAPEGKDVGLDPLV